MKNKNWIYPLINILLYAVGFPVLFIICLVKSIEWNSYGMYGASSFAPLIAVIILWALTAGIQALVYFRNKKKGKTGFSLAVKLIAVPIALIVGLFGIIDIAMPPLLDDATSGTILYEDVVNDWGDMHNKLSARVEEFKRKNNLDKSVKFSDKEFQDIFAPMFKSMDEAYNAFDPLAIEIALDQPDLIEAILNGNMPIQLAATLILSTASGNNNNHNIDNLTDLLLLNLSGIMEVVNDITANGLKTDSESINGYLNSVLVTKQTEYKDGYIKWNIFNILGSNILLADIDPNAQIDVYDEYGYSVVGTAGAALGYQDMSWLNGLPMMFFIPLMSVRDILYIFTIILGLTALMQYFVADGYAKKNQKEFSMYMLERKNKEVTAS